ncbi:MAG: hypothetical protein C0506_09995 [Anaerolinea sp.]|nr:hypothetical protein [Anaerolinea sp.]
MVAVAHVQTPRACQRPARIVMMRWLLVVAYLPTLTFLGHWPLSVDIPGTSLYVGLAERSASLDHGHKDHCHADAGSCTDTPVATSASVALLAESLQFRRTDAPFIAMTAREVRWLAQAAVTPVSPPPERLFQG